jgi:SNF2 family DNA or RNA helicase
MTEGVLVVTTKKSISQYAGVCRKYLSDRYTVIEVDDVELLDKTTKDYIYVINYEKLGSLKRTFKAVIIDESHLAKDISSDRNYFLREICKKAQYTYAYTGTPQDKRRYDIFPQLVLLDQRFMPGKTNFYKRYFKLDEYHQPDTELKERSNELTSMLNEISWGESSEKLIELTKENDIHVMVDIDLAVYNELSKERIVYVGDAPIVADNIAILKMKLREICNGHLRDEEHRLYNLYRSELEIPKIKALAELVNNLDNAIIYTQFIPDITAVTYLLTYLKKSHVTLTGLSAKKMGQRIDAFKKGEYKFLVMQAASGNAALDLTVTNNVVFYSMPESYIIYHQCKSRIRRLGQVKECNYYHLICRDTVEEKIYKALRSKKGFSTRLFKSYN